MSQRLDLTTGNILGQLTRLTAPIMFGMLAFTLYLMTDLFFVSRLGPDAVAALSISSNIFFVHLGLSFIIGTGAMALIAQGIGAGKTELARLVFEQSLILSIAAGIIVAVTGVIIAPFYISFFGGSGFAFKWGVEYFRIYSISLLFLLLLHVFGACYRGLGDTKTSMKITFISLIINIVLDPVMIFGLGPFPKLGVQGAALASLISQFIGVLIFVYLVFVKEQHLRLKGPWLPRWGIIKQSVSIGLPSGMAYFLLTANLLITYRVISAYGTHALASVGIGYRIIQTIYLPSVAVADAMAAMVGQNVGAQNTGRVIAVFWTGLRISCVFMILGTIVCWLFPEGLINIFSKETQVVQFGIVYLTIISLANLPVGFILTISAVFQGIGRTMPSLFGALVDNILFAAIVLTLPVFFGWGFQSVWWIKLVTAIVETAVLAVWLSRYLKRLPVNPSIEEQGEKTG